MNDTYEYVLKTLRATGLVALMLVAVLANVGLPWAIVPTLAGLVLAVVLLLGWWAFLRSLITLALATEEKNQRQRRTTQRFLLLALVKYPLVGWLIWWLTRHWSAQELAAFAAGFGVLTLVIALRAVGKILTEQGEVKK